MVETVRVGATNGVGGLVAQVVTTVDPVTLLPSGGSSASPSYTTIVEQAPVPLSFQQIAPVASSAIVTPGAATRAIISTTGADIRYRLDVTAPTAAIGNYLPTGKELILVGAANIAVFKCIQVSATASVNVQLFA